MKPTVTQLAGFRTPCPQNRVRGATELLRRADKAAESESGTHASTGTWDTAGPNRRPAVLAPAAAWSFLAFSSCLEVLGFILLIKRTSHCLYKRCSNSPTPPIGPVTSPGSKGWARWSECGSPSPAVEPLGVHPGTPLWQSVCVLQPRARPVCRQHATWIGGLCSPQWFLDSSGHRNHPEGLTQTRGPSARSRRWCFVVGLGKAQQSHFQHVLR